LVGNKSYGFKEACDAAGIVLWSLVKRGRATLSRNNTTKFDKVMGLMRMFNIVDQQEKKYKKSH